MNNDIDARLREEIERFTANVTLILQDAVNDAITDALGGRHRGPTAKKTTGKKAKSALASKKPGRKKRVRRSAEDLERIAGRILLQLGKKQDQGIEEIGAALKISTKDLTRPMQMLVDDKKVRKSGNRRSTRYSQK